MNLVFCGTPEFAVPTFEAVLAAGHTIALVLTQPDRPSGRRMELHAPPVKQAALAHGIPVLQPEKIRNNPELQAQLTQLKPAAILVVAYGRIIPPWMLALPPLGNINLHASLLPKYRGAAPIQWAIANGDSVTGVTTMRIDEGLDTGDMLLARAVPIAPEATAPDLFGSLSAVGADLMVDTLAGLAAGTLNATLQDHAAATLAPILTREDGRIDFTRPAATVYNRWRGFQPWPGAYTTMRDKKLIIHRMSPAEPSASAEQNIAEMNAAEPGTVIVADDKLAVACGEHTSIALEELQLEGKRRISAAEFLHGMALRPGERLGS